MTDALHSTPDAYHVRAMDRIPSHSQLRETDPETSRLISDALCVTPSPGFSPPMFKHTDGCGPAASAINHASLLHGTERDTETKAEHGDLNSCFLV